MSPRPIQTDEQATEYVAQALGSSREYRMFPFDLGWVMYPLLSEEEIEQGQHIGLTKMVLDARTGVITEFPSLPVRAVAQMYTTAIQEGTRMPGGQIYPPRTRVHMTLVRDNPGSIEYLIRPESTTDPQPTADYLIVIDKDTRVAQPPGTVNMIAASWIDHCRRRDGAWPSRTVTEY